MPERPHKRVKHKLAEFYELISDAPHALAPTEKSRLPKRGRN